jgi:hypothetical protein
MIEPTPLQQMRKRNGLDIRDIRWASRNRRRILDSYCDSFVQVHWLCYSDISDIVERLFEKGFSPLWYGAAEQRQEVR